MDFPEGQHPIASQSGDPIVKGKFSKEQHKNTARPKQIIRTIISVALMVWLLSMFDWQEAMNAIKDGSPFYFILAFLAIQITVVSSILKWKMLAHSSLKGKNLETPSLHRFGRLYYVGLFFNNFLPSSVGGDVVRVYYLGRTIGMPPAAASVAFERITSGAVMIVIVLVAALFMESIRSFLMSIYLIIGIFIALFFHFVYWMKKQGKEQTSRFQWLEKVKQGLVKTGNAAVDYRKEGFSWWLWIAIYSILFQVGMAWINDLLFKGFGYDIGIFRLMVIITLISIITMLPISLNGIGVREASYLFFFQTLGIPDEVSVSVSLLFFILVSISSLFGGWFWLTERKEQRNETIR